MSQFIYETHCHSREGSACAQSNGADLVHAYKNKGYSGLIMTDHFFYGNTAVPTDLSWEERVAQFMYGYENALNAATSINQLEDTSFSVFFGWEYNFFGSEFLIYGLDQEFLLAYPQMLKWSITTFFDYVHEAGGFITHAHPFRQAGYIKQIRLYPEKVDAVEVVNKSHTNPSFNKKALAYANAHNLLKSSGSDTHSIYNINGGGLIFSRQMLTIHDLLEAFRNGESDYIR